MPLRKRGSVMTWDSMADAQLFKCLLDVHEIKPDHKKLEEKMRALGYEITAKAITHRIHVIRHKIYDPASASDSPAPKKGKANNADATTSTTKPATTSTLTKKDTKSVAGLGVKPQVAALEGKPATATNLAAAAKKGDKKANVGEKRKRATTAASELEEEEESEGEAVLGKKVKVESGSRSASISVTGDEGSGEEYKAGDEEEDDEDEDILAD
ncbi:MAG: hypothetical protein Q9219_000605 [cf. Caloplaca sp. 3 TL-2023]